MEDETLNPFLNQRISSISPTRDFTQRESVENDADDDPISAYFKKRCENSQRHSFKKLFDFDRESSIDLIDVDNVSLFGDDDDDVDGNEELIKNSLPFYEGSKDGKKSFGSMKHSDASSGQVIDSEMDLEKQRALAQKVLMKVNNQCDETQNECSQMKGEKVKEDRVLADLSKNFNANLNLSKEPEKKWFQPNYSPNTPRYFNDELSSIGGEDSVLTKNEVNLNLPPRESSVPIPKTRLSQYAKKMNSTLKESNQLDLSSDIEFKSQSKEEQIHRFEEDERKFKLENSALLHNSGISQFSGVTGGEISRWSSVSSNISKTNSENKKMSIGEFFNKRSNRVSSLIGSTGSSVAEKTLSPPKSIKNETQKSLVHEQSLPITNVSKAESLKPRRCASTFDLNPFSEISKTRRSSNDSSTSNSTVMIQNILAEMESGLSGTQIYDKLIKAYGIKRISMREKKALRKEEELQDNNETPKSSKISAKNGFKQTGNDFKKETKNLKHQLEFDMRTPSPNNEFKENIENNRMTESNSNQSVSILRDEKIKKLKGKKGFDASTPKLHQLKSQNGKFVSGGNKGISTDKNDWEAPRISSIQSSADLNKTEEGSEETVKDSTILRLDSSKRNNTILIDSTVEDTIVAGDLTVLSQRIEEMKGDGVCIVRSAENEEPVLLTVVQKLANLPKGSVNCSALTPLLRDQFPELLSTFPTPPRDSTYRKSFHNSWEKNPDLLVSEPGCWVKLPERMGFKEKLNSYVEVKKTIFIPISNVSKNWLLASIKSVLINHPNGNKLTGIKTNDEWNVCDFVLISMKSTIIPPSSKQSLQVFYTSKVPAAIDLRLSISFKQLLGQEAQLRTLQLRTHNMNPSKSINVIPNDLINFGVISDQCSDQRTIQITFDGICELPVVVFIEEKNSHSPQFFLKPSSVRDNSKGDWIDGKFHCRLNEGEKQKLDFLVLFQPDVTSSVKILHFKASLVIRIGMDTESDGVLHRIPIKGSVGFAKFLWSSSCSPFVFHVPVKGQSLTRSFPLKNVGSLPIAFSVRIENEETREEEEDDLFTAPKNFFLSKNEESSISITFNSKSDENCVKRLLILQIQPNGRAKYDVQLIGLTNSNDNRPRSRTSNGSASTRSLSNSDSAPVKLLTNAQSLSWPSVALEKEMRQTFQLKNASSYPVTARITFRSNMGSFKMVNENGEKVQKIRKVLKPDCPFNLTIVFRPDFLGSHHNAVFIETNQLSGRKMILLNGIGGMPNLFLGNVKSDLNGCKMIVLHNSPSSNQIFSNTLEFKNEGRIPGFILIKPSIEVLTLSHELTVSPCCCVLAPNSKISVRLSQMLKNDDIRQLLLGKDISKLATLSVIMGDEPSRLRLRKLVENGKAPASERTKILTGPYEGEREMNVDSFEDSLAFQNLFLKSLRIIEVAVVVERSLGICEPTILVDEDETIDEFVTICSAFNSTIASTVELDNQNSVEYGSRKSKNKSPANSAEVSKFSINSASSHCKISKWLETLDYSSKKP